MGISITLCIMTVVIGGYIISRLNRANRELAAEAKDAEIEARVARESLYGLVSGCGPATYSIERRDAAYHVVMARVSSVWRVDWGGSHQQVVHICVKSFPFKDDIDFARREAEELLAALNTNNL